MKVVALTVEGFRGCPDGTYRFGSGAEPESMVVIGGEASSGKTSLLEAIACAKEAVGAYGRSPRATDAHRSGCTRTVLEVVWRLSDAERSRTELDATVTTRAVFDADGLVVEGPTALRSAWEAYPPGQAPGKAEYFPATRRIGAFRTGPLPGTIRSFHDRLRRDDGKYDWVPAFFVAEERRHAISISRAAAETGLSLAGELHAFREAVNVRLARLAPHLRYVGAREIAGGVEPWFATRAGSELGFSALSSTEEQAVLFVGASLHLGLSGSLLLIDSPEAHQAPADHARFTEGLAALGKDNQLIVATSSNRVASVAPQHAVIRLGGGR